MALSIMANIGVAFSIAASRRDATKNNQRNNAGGISARRSVAWRRGAWHGAAA